MSVFEVDASDLLLNSLATIPVANPVKVAEAHVGASEVAFDDAILGDLAFEEVFGHLFHTSKFKCCFDSVFFVSKFNLAHNLMV